MASWRVGYRSAYDATSPLLVQSGIFGRLPIQAVACRSPSASRATASSLDDRGCAGNSRGPGITVRPNCSNSFPWSNSNQCSATLPSTMRLISTDVKATSLFVGGRPWNSPWWVPRKAIRAATVSSLQPISSIREAEDREIPRQSPRRRAPPRHRSPGCRVHRGRGPHSRGARASASACLSRSLGPPRSTVEYCRFSSADTADPFPRRIASQDHRRTARPEERRLPCEAGFSRFVQSG